MRIEKLPGNAIPTIAIVGAGFSGSLVAAQLLKQASGPLAIKLIERNPRQLHRGVAYSTDAHCHLLNVPAGNMSAYPDDPEHFLRWALSQQLRLINPPWVSKVTFHTYLPRRAYGEYINWALQEAISCSQPDVRLEIVQDEVTCIQPSIEGTSLVMRNSRHIEAQQVVLALGNFPPGDPPVANGDFYRSHRYLGNPWSEEARSNWADVESCLIVGTGLTMVDWALHLSNQNYRGVIHVVSRRGLMPATHADVDKVPFWLDIDIEQLTVRSILRKFRERLQLPGASQNNWRGLIDALRPHAQDIWCILPIVERRRFLRHLRPLWDNHRHRISPIAAEKLAELIQRGQLRYHTGRIENYREKAGKVEVSLRLRRSGNHETLTVDRIMNCTGTECDYRKLQHPLIASLLAQGLAQPDALSFGLATAANGALMDPAGSVSTTLFTLGPQQKGTLWETTAVPEIRVQAARLARTLLSGIKAAPEGLILNFNQ